jgi:hypothetical protein
MPEMTRRSFLKRTASLPALLSHGTFRREPSREWLRESSVAAALASGRPLPAGLAFDLAASEPPRPLSDRFSELDRHFVFEYYPWYRRDPWRHWDADGHAPPEDLASEYVPRLGAYDSRDTSTLEQHARWIAESGAGSIAISWWGRGSYEDRSVHQVMDVMKQHGIAVTFGLEPYDDHRGAQLADDVHYLLREYGEKRGWDSFLVLRNEDGSEAPVFKVFRSILPDAVVDCHGVRQAVPDYTADETWRAQIEAVRRGLRWDFDRILLLADSLDFGRTPAAGFDGIGIYDNFIGPERYHPLAREASAAGLLFSFNVNPGYDEIRLDGVPPGSCYEPRPFSPPTGPLDFERSDHRELAAELSSRRIRESLEATLQAQTDTRLENYRRGFFLVYLNSFNEWHEGHAFEPAKDDLELSASERGHGYHNPSYGSYRLKTLAASLRPLLTAEAAEGVPAGLHGARHPRA